ncbi:MAG: response regulator [Boseongicola sp. SB0677_bin_26]|nr:response regulator [Boseongicola sp. SB0665_bin_10]MYG26410.1 response regulator [Boseongicola sp. SB0677_bin_26]
MSETAGLRREIDGLRGEVAELHERVSALCAAGLRIGSSLDLETVLDEIAGSARALTGARFAAIATIDEDGNPVDFVTSGFTEAEHRAMAEWSDGPKLFEHFRDLEGPLRIADVPGHVRELGFSADRLPWGTFQGTPMRHRGVHVGNFYLVGKEGGEAFTDADEEILALFAAQAAAAIANARAYRDERRARADLEALVETSPVGVVVFDAATGRPASLNREARRIVEGLASPESSPDELLGIVTCRFADGREIALDRLPITDALSGAETVRAEEIEISVPDGASVTTLVNATPIQAPDGTLESVVVTMQDLAPLEELDRMRAEFLGMVSHELRTPLTSIKGSTAAVLGATREFGLAETREFVRIVDEQAERMFGLVTDLLDAGRIDAGTLSVSPEPTEVAFLIDRARTTFVSGGGRHAVQVDLPPDMPRVMADRQRVVQVLSNLLANAARSAPDSSPIRVSAERDGVHAAISVADEGRGMTPEHLARLFRKHSVTDGGEGGVRGSGLGLAICKGLVEAHGGRIRAESGGPGQGARFTFTLPLAPGADAPGAAPDRPEPARRRAAESVLVVDDDPQILRLVRDALAEAGYAPIVTGDHRDLAAIVRAEKPALVLLDLVLPGADGIELMRTVPELAFQPVIFISAYGRDETVARALEAGAADYIVKPFSPTELAARVGAALRRHADPEPFVLGDLAIDYDRRRVSVAGRTVELTPTEYDLLRTLSLNAGRVTTYEALLDQVWSDRSNGSWKVVRAFVKQLRAKLGDAAASPAWIFNVRGVGYRMPRPGEPSEG